MTASRAGDFTTVSGTQTQDIAWEGFEERPDVK
jgi:hypothetical protein